MISSTTINTIINASEIVEVISEFVRLKKKGANFMALCPFHNEKTPSFTVSPSRQIFKCFGCGKGGNVINFLMEHEKYTYYEAIKFLAKKYNIEIEEIIPSDDEAKKAIECESLFNILLFAQKYFTNTLFNTDEGKAIGLSYLKQRGFTEEIIEKFQLGYCSDRGTDFTLYALKQGYKPEQIIKAGLTTKESNQDFFKGRVVFPIHNITGRIIGFGGRTLSHEDNIAKYKNSPESDVYNKSKILYGIFFARNSIVKENNCYLVEGYTDVISLFQVGINNVVASSGTSLTTDQIQLIKRYTPNITILYDGDMAGIKASFRGIDMILEQGLNVRVVPFPEGEDPDSFAKKTDKDELKKFISANTQDFITFKINHLLKEIHTDPIKKAQLVQDIINSIALIPTKSTIEIYIKQCSNLLNIDEQRISEEVNQKIVRKNTFRNKTLQEGVKTTIQPTETPDLSITIPTEFQEKDIIRVLLNYGNKEIIFEEEIVEKDDNTDDSVSPLLKGDMEITPLKKKKIKVKIKVAEFIINELKKKDDITFKNPVYQQIYEEICSLHGMIPDSSYFTHHANPKISELAVDLTFPKYTLSDWETKMKITMPPDDENKWKEDTVKSLLSLKCKIIEQKINENEKKIKDSKTEEDYNNLFKERRLLDELKILIAKELNRVIVS